MTSRLRRAAPLPRSPGPRVLRAFVLLAALLTLAWNSYAQTLIVSSWGGLYAESQRKAYFEPFTTATGIQVVEDAWGGDLAKVRAMVASGRYQSHVLDAESSDLVRGCADGILEPIDYTRLGLSAQDMLPGAAQPCGVGNVAWSMVLVFDRARLGGNGPEGWADFFDLTEYPGGRGLRRGPLGNRVDGRRGRTGGCLRAAAYGGRYGSSVREAGDTRAARDVVGSRTPARPAPRRWGRSDDHCLEWADTAGDHR